MFIRTIIIIYISGIHSWSYATHFQIPYIIFNQNMSSFVLGVQICEGPGTESDLTE
jgi:hypothetical protein